MGRNASIATTQNTDCSTVNPHVHFTPDYSNMRVYGGPFADGKKKRVFINRQGKPLYGSYGNTYKFNNKPNGKCAVHMLVKDLDIMKSHKQ